MSSKDVFHTVVKNALQKNNWHITHDPLFIRSGKVEFYIDLGAERVIAADKDGQKIAVEVKSFIGQSAISEFHTALGQFLNYRLALEAQEADRALYLAVPLDTYETFFTLPFTEMAIQRYQIKLIVYSIKDEVIVKWQE
ncbi:fdxN element excision controlling factor protein XisH [Cylindrospermum sp. NIES-4074]|nr:fdxN element excision controlling factor protein XisH [Cylindrospermum sp. NIES-4074]